MLPVRIQHRPKYRISDLSQVYCHIHRLCQLASFIANQNHSTKFVQKEPISIEYVTRLLVI